MVFACYKFYDYIYGKPVVIETDHHSQQAISHHPSLPATHDVRVAKILTYKKGKHLY